MPTLRNYALLQWSVASTFCRNIFRLVTLSHWHCLRVQRVQSIEVLRKNQRIQSDLTQLVGQQVDGSSWKDLGWNRAHNDDGDLFTAATKESSSYSTWLWVILRILTASSSQARTSDLSAGNRFYKSSRDVLRSNSLNMGIKICPEKLPPPYFQSKFRFGIFPPGQLCKTSFPTVHNHIFSVHCL